MTARGAKGFVIAGLALQPIHTNIWSTVVCATSLDRSVSNH